MIKNFLLIPALMLAPFSAHAIVWNTQNTNNCLNGCTALYDGTPPSNGNSQAFSGFLSGDPKVTVSAFSTTPTTTISNEKFGAATLVLYNGNGLGATAATLDGSLGSQPDHAFDNDGSASNTTDYGPGGAVDAALFAFDQSINLTSLSIGYKYGDADISVLAYTGTGGPASIIGKTFADLLANGWEFIGNFMNLDVSSNPATSPSTTITTAASSSYWLVSAYTSCANGTCASDSSFGNDYFKISGLGGKLSTSGNGDNTGSVPEPSSMILLVGGLLGWRLNRQNKV